MTDIVGQTTRSRMMSGIRGKDTKPEMVIRKTLFARGFRYRLHDKKLPGKPDLVLKKYNSVIFIHGCFWHGHNCHLFKWPKTNMEFWRNKIQTNMKKDVEIKMELLEMGWRVLVVWECALKGKTRIEHPYLFQLIIDWLSDTNNRHYEIEGKV